MAQIKQKNFIFRLTKMEDRLKCDFCPLMFHLTCLFLSHGTISSKEKVWMCPNHIEHYLDIHFLKSSRLSDRLNLWNKYSINSSVEADSIVHMFLSKCKRERSSMSETTSHDKIQASLIPESIKDVYSRPVSLQLNTSDYEEETNNFNGNP